MSGRIHTCIAQSVTYEGLIGQGLQSCTGLGNDDEESMRDIDGFQYSGCIIGVYIADKTGFHLKGIICFCPVFQCQINGAGTQIASADSDLYSCGKLFTCCICDLTCMNLVCKISGLFLLGCVELTLVDAVCDDVAHELAAAELVKNETLLTCVDHSAAQKLFVFINELMLVCKFLKDVEGLIINCFCSVIVLHPACHGNTVLGYACCAVLACHGIYDIDAAFQRHKFVINSEGVQVFPGNHLKCPPSIWIKNHTAVCTALVYNVWVNSPPIYPGCAMRGAEIPLLPLTCRFGTSFKL